MKRLSLLVLMLLMPFLFFSACVFSSENEVVKKDPCSGKQFLSTNTHFRSHGSGESFKAAVAKRKAHMNANSGFAKEIRTYMDKHSVKANKNFQYEEFVTENRVRTSLNMTLNQVSTICEEVTQNKETKIYTAYVCTEVPIKLFFETMSEQLSKEEQSSEDKNISLYLDFIQNLLGDLN